MRGHAVALALLGAALACAKHARAYEHKTFRLLWEAPYDCMEADPFFIRKCDLKGGGESKQLFSYEQTKWGMRIVSTSRSYTPGESCLGFKDCNSGGWFSNKEQCYFEIQECDGRPEQDWSLTECGFKQYPVVEYRTYQIKNAAKDVCIMKIKNEKYIRAVTCKGLDEYDQQWMMN